MRETTWAPLRGFTRIMPIDYVLKPHRRGRLTADCVCRAANEYKRAGGFRGDFFHWTVGKDWPVF
jgi:hypothetical protein